MYKYLIGCDWNKIANIKSLKYMKQGKNGRKDFGELNFDTELKY